MKKSENRRGDDKNEIEESVENRDTSSFIRSTEIYFHAPWFRRKPLLLLFSCPLHVYAYRPPHKVASPVLNRATRYNVCREAKITSALCNRALVNYVTQDGSHPSG